MLKNKLITSIAKKHKISKALVNDIIVSFIEGIKQEVQEGREYHHWGFGKFVQGHRKSRKIHDVASREIKILPAKKTLKFVPSRELNKTLN